MPTNNLRLRRRVASILSCILPLVLSQRLRSMIYSARNGIQEAATFKKRALTGSLFTGNTRDLHAGKFAVHGFYDWRNVAIAKALRQIPGDIIEVGANIGTETVCFSDLVGNNRSVFTFEPFEGNLLWLNRNAQLTKQQNIEVFPFAITNTTGTFSFAPPRDDHSTGTGRLQLAPTNSDSDVTVQCYRLDDLLNHFNHVKAVFIDIEGADFLAIEGAQSLIARDRPLIVLEVSPKLMSKFSTKPEDIQAYMVGLGYSVFTIGKTRLTEVDLLQKRHANWICLPDDASHLKKQINRSILLTALIPPLLQQLGSKTY